LTEWDDRIESWVRRVAPRAIGYAKSLLSRPDRAEDIVQDVFLRLFEHSEYDLVKDGDKLLFRSVTNACLSARLRARELRSLDAGRGDGGTLAEGLSNPGADDPLRVAVTRETLEAVGEELSAMPPMQRAAVELKAMGSSLRDIADALDTSEANAGVLVHRGRKRLKQKLGAMLPGGLQ